MAMLPPDPLMGGGPMGPPPMGPPPMGPPPGMGDPMGGMLPPDALGPMGPGMGPPPPGPNTSALLQLLVETYIAEAGGQGPLPAIQGAEALGGLPPMGGMPPVPGMPPGPPPPGLPPMPPPLGGMPAVGQPGYSDPFAMGP